jgi:hypothetical protein
MKTLTGDGLIEVVSKGGVNDARVHGRYQQVGNFYFLRQWRVSFHLPTSARRTEGNWYRIHGNQKKDIGALRLVCSEQEFERYERRTEQ